MIIESGIQRTRRRPAVIDIVDGAGVILEFPDRSRPSQGGGHVGEVGLDAHDGKGLGVDLQDLVAGVVAGEGGDGGADEAHLERFGVVDRGGVANCTVGEGGGGVVVEDLELVFVGWWIVG